MSNTTNENNKEVSNGDDGKNKKLILLVSVVALILVAAISLFVLNKLKSTESGEGLSQEQFEGSADISSQLQIECQNSASLIAKSTSAAEAETEYRKHFENCKNVFFAFDFETPYRKEGVYADLVVDLAKIYQANDKQKAISLLKEIKALGEWDFSLGPVSCSSGGVLDAYIESYSLDRGSSCYSKDDIKSKIIPAIQTKDFSILQQATKNGEVVWLGIPDSDVGCPEKLSSSIQTLKKLTQGSFTVEEAAVEHTEKPQTAVNIKLSDKEMISLIFNIDSECAQLTTILVPNSEVVE